MIGNKRDGFTLVELLVVVAIFSLTFLVGTGVFTNIQTFQRGVLARQRVAADGRYLLESMARTVRLGSIDYTYYRDPDGNGNFSDAIDLTNPTTILVVRDQLNVQTCYRINAAVIEIGTSCTAWTALTPSDLTIQQFDVRIHPRSNPYLPAPTASSDCKSTNFDPVNGICTCAAPPTDTINCFLDQRCVDTSAAAGVQGTCLNATIQPHVTITLLTQTANPTGGESARTRLQTTVTSRIYGQ